MDDFHTAWYPVSLDGGVYTTDLFLNSTGLQWTENESFGGWLGTWRFNSQPRSLPLSLPLSPLGRPTGDTNNHKIVCEWSHGVPQLFWKVNYISYPSPVCAQVELRPVAKGKTFTIKKF